MIISTNPSAAARAAAQQLIDRVHAYMVSHPESELHRCGKMFGVLLYNSPLDGFSQLSIPSDRSPKEIRTLNSPLYLSAFSAKLDGSYHHDGFVPPVYEMSAPPVGTSREESQRLQRLLFANYTFLNSHGQTKNLLELFENEKIISADEWFNQPLNSKLSTLNSKLSTSLNSKLSTLNYHLPPSGAGECCAPKLLQYAYAHGLTPIELAEFWIGAPSHTEIRQEGTFYLPCSGKCTPILRHMVDGYEIQDQRATWKSSEIEVLYEDEVIMVINKPAGLLSVPGKNDEPSVQSLLKAKPVHRLDQDTSGLLVLAKTPEAYTALQSYFQRRDVLKRYVAIVKPNPLSTLNSQLDGFSQLSTLNSKLDGFSQLSTLNSKLLEGLIDLPLLPNPYDRPRQMVDLEHGKTAITRYVIREQRPDGTLLVDFYPLTGRTHQLRVHAAHPDGLNAPIVGDRLYSDNRSPLTANRLMLHAAEISFPHPLTGEMMHFTDEKSSPIA